MNWIPDTTRALSATVKLILHDREGLSEFDNSTKGFWRSFSAILFIIPLWLFIGRFMDLAIAELDPLTETENAPKKNQPLMEIIGLGLQWAIWPITMALVTRSLGLGRHFTRYIIVYNWSNVILSAFIALPVVFFLTGIFSSQSIGLLMSLLVYGTFYFEWYLTRLCLETTGLIAGAIVLGNFMLSLSIVRIIG